MAQIWTVTRPVSLYALGLMGISLIDLSETNLLVSAQLEYLITLEG